MNVGTGSSNLEKFETRNFEIIKNVYKFLEYRNNPSYTNICVFNQKELNIYIIIECSSKSCRKIQKFTTARNSNKQRLRVNIHNNAEIRRNSNKYGNDKLTC